MAKKSIRKSVNDIIQNSSVMSDNIKQNAEIISRFGIDVPVFSAGLDADVEKVKELHEKKKRIMSEQKQVTLELNELLARVESQYALCKKTVKLAEPKSKWVAYGILDKK